MAKQIDAPEIFKNITRYTTAAERSRIEKIEVNEGDIENFLEMFRMGLIGTATSHEAAVQGNMLLRVEASIRLSRPVYNSEKDIVEEFAAHDIVVGELHATKKFKN